MKELGHMAPLALAHAPVLLADVAVGTVGGAAFTFLGAGSGLDDVLERVAGFGLQFAVVVGAVHLGAVTAQVVVVAWSLLAEAGVVYGPFFDRGGADEGVDSLAVFVQGDEAGDCGGGEDIGNVGSIAVVWDLLVVGGSGLVVRVGAVVSQAAEALRVLVSVEERGGGSGLPFGSTCTVLRVMRSS